MIIIGTKAKEGKKQFLVVDEEYDVEESTGKAIIKAGRGKLKGSKEKTK